MKRNTSDRLAIMLLGPKKAGKMKMDAEDKAEMKRGKKPSVKEERREKSPDSTRKMR